jgi:hypothetical protein
MAAHSLVLASRCEFAQCRLLCRRVDCFVCHWRPPSLTLISRMTSRRPSQCAWLLTQHWLAAVNSCQKFTSCAAAASGTQDKGRFAQSKQPWALAPGFPPRYQALPGNGRCFRLRRSHRGGASRTGHSQAEPGNENKNRRLAPCRSRIRHCE